MITLAFVGLLAASMALAISDWRRAWFAAVLCGVLQDPIRKITTGTPVALTMSVVAVYAAILFGALGELKWSHRDFERRFPRINALFTLFIVFLVIAALNGLATFGLRAWQAPALSLLTYMIPIPAILMGYAWLRREEQLVSFFTFYAALTSVALVGTVLEYFAFDWQVLGVVAAEGIYLRHLPGLQIPMLSGFYRAPDIMGWHAAMVTCVAITMAVRTRVLVRAWPWVGIAAWGFLSCIISGRRKAIYMVAAFAIAFFWRYLKRVTGPQFVSVVLLVLAIGGVVRKIESSENTRVYAAGAVTSREEVLQRMEGGFLGTLRQSGFLGEGLGSATQGVRHVTGAKHDFGWQEGGLGKLTVELGVPGLAAAVILAWAMLRMMVRISGIGNLPGTNQILRAALLAMAAANAANFLASAQAYSDPLLALMAAFLLGCLFATARLDEAAPQHAPQPAATMPLAELSAKRR